MLDNIAKCQNCSVVQMSQLYNLHTKLQTHSYKTRPPLCAASNDNTVRTLPMHCFRKVQTLKMPREYI